MPTSQFLDSTNSPVTSAATTTAGATVCSKRRRETETSDDYQPLLPGLPDHLAQLSLSLVHPSLLNSVCHSWRRLIYSPFFPPFLALYALTTPTTTTTTQGHSNSIELISYDPITSKWHHLPPPPPDPPLRPLLRHPAFISRNLPIQSVAASDHLVILAATTDHLLPALSRPFLFHPPSNQWSFGPPISAPRRWCAAGSVKNIVYLASGVGHHYSGNVARSAERWDLTKKKEKKGLNWEWEKVSGLKDGRFSREAVEAVGWRGKLCMVNVKGKALKEGVVYDVEKGRWEEMPAGMLGGWNGPATAMHEEVMYVVDEAQGVLKRYEAERDEWDGVMESEMLKGAEQIAAKRGRVCVVSGGGGRIVVVDVVARPVRMWVVDPPPGLQVVGIHVLTRTNRPDDSES